MLYGVKLNKAGKVKQGGVIYGKKEGLIVFTFYIAKTFEKVLKCKFLSVKK